MPISFDWPTGARLPPLADPPGLVGGAVALRQASGVKDAVRVQVRDPNFARVRSLTGGDYRVRLVLDGLQNSDRPRLDAGGRHRFQASVESPARPRESQQT